MFMTRLESGKGGRIERNVGRSRFAHEEGDGWVVGFDEADGLLRVEPVVRDAAVVPTVARPLSARNFLEATQQPLSLIHI